MSKRRDTLLYFLTGMADPIATRQFQKILSAEGKKEGLKEQIEKYYKQREKDIPGQYGQRGGGDMPEHAEPRPGALPRLWDEFKHGVRKGIYKEKGIDTDPLNLNPDKLNELLQVKRSESISFEEQLDPVWFKNVPGLPKEAASAFAALVEAANKRQIKKAEKKKAERLANPPSVPGVTPPAVLEKPGGADPVAEAPTPTAQDNALDHLRKQVSLKVAQFYDKHKIEFSSPKDLTFDEKNMLLTVKNVDPETAEKLLVSLDLRPEAIKDILHKANRTKHSPQDLMKANPEAADKTFKLVIPLSELSSDLGTAETLQELAKGKKLLTKILERLGNVAGKNYADVAVIGTKDVPAPALEFNGRGETFLLLMQEIGVAGNLSYSILENEARYTPKPKLQAEKAAPPVLPTLQKKVG